MKLKPPETMDKPLIRNRWQRLRNKVVGIIAAGVIIGLWIMAFPKSGNALTVAINEIQIAKVSEGIFEDFIPLRAQVTPRNTVYLDAVEGGRVETIHLEDGAHVTAGQPIVNIVNTRLQLEAISREAQVSEQINLMQSQELSLARNELEHRRNLNDLQFQIDKTRRQLNRMIPLAKSGNIARVELEMTEKELAYLLQRQQLTLEAHAADKALQEAQLHQLRGSVENLKNNLHFSRKNLDNLNVKSPVTGRLTAFVLEVGQSLMPGERFGQIDDPTNFKLTAMADEFYMGRIFTNQSAQVTFDEKNYPLSVAKIYPQVVDGQFKIDFLFAQEQPTNLNRGQSLQLRLQLDENRYTHLIPNGSFVQETGGNWIFALTPDRKTAIRRTIKTGRRNSHYIEIIAGLSADEQVIISPYTRFGQIDRINIQ